MSMSCADMARLNFLSLPAELLLRVLYFVDVPELVATSRVGRQYDYGVAGR